MSRHSGGRECCSYSALGHFCKFSPNSDVVHPRTDTSQVCCNACYAGRKQSSRLRAPSEQQWVFRDGYPLFPEKSETRNPGYSCDCGGLFVAIADAVWTPSPLIYAICICFRGQAFWLDWEACHTRHKGSDSGSERLDHDL